MFHNPLLEDKIARVQAEFNALLNEQSTTSPERRRVGDSLHMDEFYQVMGEFYDSGMKKHESPTRRLMDQQKASWKHKNHLFKKQRTGDIDVKGQYSLTYTVDPSRTYVIQPKEGEINYDLA